MPNKNTNYNKTAMDELAANIEDIKSRYTSIIEQLNNEITELHSYWNDDASGGQVYQTFKGSFDKLRPSLEEGTKYIRRFEDSVMEQKERYASAENKIIGSF